MFLHLCAGAAFTSKGLLHLTTLTSLEGLAIKPAGPKEAVVLGALGQVKLYNSVSAHTIVHSLGLYCKPLWPVQALAVLQHMQAPCAVKKADLVHKKLAVILPGPMHC